MSSYKYKFHFGTYVRSLSTTYSWNFFFVHVSSFRLWQNVLTFPSIADLFKTFYTYSLIFRLSSTCYVSCIHRMSSDISMQRRKLLTSIPRYLKKNFVIVKVLAKITYQTKYFFESPIQQCFSQSCTNIISDVMWYKSQIISI